MTQNPVIEKLVKGAVERCRERIAAAKADDGTIRIRKQAAGTGITGSTKQSHGL